MNKTLFFSAVAIALLLQACTPQVYYQLYTTKTVSEKGKSSNPLQYEDDNCIISYNLWASGGDPSFTFYNKTEKLIYLNLSKTFYINNGRAYDYFQNRTYSSTIGSNVANTRSKSAAVSNTGIDYLDAISTVAQSASYTKQVSSMSEQSVSRKEVPFMAIPPHSSKTISEFKVAYGTHRDCELVRFPRRKEIATESFTQEKSPYTFTNMITYSVGKDGKAESVKNAFYVSEITNFSQYEFMETIYPEFCGEKSLNSILVFKKRLPNQFYIKYNRGAGTSKH